MTRAQILDTITNIHRDIAEAHQILCRVTRSAEALARGMAKPAHVPLPGQGASVETNQEDHLAPGTFGGA